MTREDWFYKSIPHLQKLVFKDIEIPKNTKISCGFGTISKAIGVCFSKSCTDDNRSEIFIQKPCYYLI